MRMTKDSYESMNKLMAKCFNANAIFDNLAYNLDYHYFSQIAEIVHHNVAHIMPEWADIISEKMLELSVRPTRLDINGYQEEYTDLKEIFNTIYTVFEDLRSTTRNLIAQADINDDDEVRIFGENFLEVISPFLKQSEEWINAASILSPSDLNIHIKEYTHFIAL